MYIILSMRLFVYYIMELVPYAELVALEQIKKGGQLFKSDKQNKLLTFLKLQAFVYQITFSFFQMFYFIFLKKEETKAPCFQRTIGPYLMFLILGRRCINKCIIKTMTQQ